MNKAFIIVKRGAYYKVVGAFSGVVMFTSMLKANCKDFITDNFPD